MDLISIKETSGHSFGPLLSATPTRFRAVLTLAPLLRFNSMKSIIKLGKSFILLAYRLCTTD